jgi:hypothetical protein
MREKRHSSRRKTKANAGRYRHASHRFTACGSFDREGTVQPGALAVPESIAPGGWPGTYLALKYQYVGGWPMGGTLAQ